MIRTFSVIRYVPFLPVLQLGNPRAQSGDWHARFRVPALFGTGAMSWAHDGLGNPRPWYHDDVILRKVMSECFRSA
jgi:hypothetical protein